MTTQTTEKKHLNAECAYDNSNDVIGVYLNQINQIPLMTREEETECAIKAAAGDKAAKDRLVSANLRFAVKIAKKYQNRGLPLSDLISEANIGLINAAERFDVTKGVHFISYAVWWIRQAIMKAIGETTRTIRIPLNRVDEVNRIERARRENGLFGNTDKEIQEIASMLNLNDSYVRDMIAISREMVSLDAPITGDAESRAFGELIEDQLHETPEEYAADALMHHDISTALNTLTDREADVLRYRYGLNGGEPMSLKEIGDIFHVTKERVRQIEKKALIRMQSSPEAYRLESYVA